MDSNLYSIKKRLDAIESLLLSQKNVLTFSEAAVFTGLAPSYMYKLTSKGIIPHSKPNGKQIYFSRDELERWLLKNRIKTRDELEVESTSYTVRNQKGGER